MAQPSLVASPASSSEPTAGFIFAPAGPVGNPSDASYVLPLLDQVEHAITRVSGPKTPAIHSVAGDLGVNDAALRQVFMSGGFSVSGSPRRSSPSTLRLAEDSGPAQRGGLAPQTDPVPGAAGLCLWLQPPGGRKSHCQFARSWGRPHSLQRSSGRRRATGHDGDGPYRGRPGAHSSAASVETSTKVPPIAGVEMP